MISLFQFCMHPVHPGINPIKCHRFFMDSLLGYFSVGRQDYHVQILDGGKTVDDNDGSPVSAVPQQGTSDLLPRDGVHGTGGLGFAEKKNRPCARTLSL